MKGIVISAPQSGSGKTTVALGLMAAFRRRGLKVAPFKAGPDFIDPGYHRQVTGTPSVNLDGWMTPPHFVKSTFLHHSSAADLSLIEGVMGLFDGLGASSQEGSTAQIARITGAPVVLVVNVRGMAASIVPLVSGFARFDPDVHVVGVIFNNVGGDRHAALLAQALAEQCPEVRFLGAIPRDEHLEIPSRHLGLVTAEDNPLDDGFIGRLADTVERHLDLELLVRLADMRPIPAPCPLHSALRANTTFSPVRLAVARDRAFSFIYEDNLRLMREAGAEITFFSPLEDPALPEGAQGVYLPGGYPELCQEQLSANQSMLDSIRKAVATGLPAYAECGGLLYLTSGIATKDKDDVQHKLAGIFPAIARMGERRAALGYREVELTRDTILGIRGERLRGHEFHYSYIEEMPDQIKRAYQVSRPGEKGVPEGFVSGSCIASYVHLHFGSFPHQARFIIEACRPEMRGVR